MTKKMIKTNNLYRAFSPTAEDIHVISAEALTLLLSCSSEYQVRRCDWSTGTEYLEILSHDTNDIDLSRFLSGAAFVDGHYGDQLGVVSDPEIVDRKLFVTVKFSPNNPRAQMIYQDITGGIRRNVSVRPEITGAGVCTERQNGIPVIRFPWRPVHVATVADPADPAVGAGRSKDSETLVLTYTDSISQPKLKETFNMFREFLISLGMDRNADDTAMHEFLNRPEIQTKLNERMRSAPTVPSVPNLPKHDDVRAAEQTRIREITALGRSFEMSEEAINRAVSENTSVDDFRAHVVTRLQNDRKLTPANRKSVIGLNERDLSQYSVVRALQALVTDRTLDGLEKECSDEVTKIRGNASRGFYIPDDILLARGMTAGNSASAGNLIQTQTLSGSMIQELTDALILPRLGTKLLPGLVGDIAIPSDEGGIQAYWIGENGAPSESVNAFGQIGMKPKTVAGLVNLSRRLLIQTGSWVEAFVRTKLMTAIALKIQEAALLGTGAKGQPKGILNLIPDENFILLGTNGDKLSWANIVAMETKIESDNALFGNMGYLTNSRVKGQLKVTEKFVNTGKEIWADGTNAEGIVNGYRAIVTNMLKPNIVKGTSKNCSPLIFGNWASVVMGFWSGLDVTIDRATKVKTAGVNIIAFQDCDIALERKVSFSVIKDIVA